MEKAGQLQGETFWYWRGDWLATISWAAPAPFLFYGAL